MSGHDRPLTVTEWNALKTAIDREHRRRIAAEQAVSVVRAAVAKLNADLDDVIAAAARRGIGVDAALEALIELGAVPGDRGQLNLPAQPDDVER